MPRFSDEWIIDRVLFESVAGGSCACCGFQHFLPGGTADLINAVSDIDTDQASAEVAALQNHPWPVTLRDQVWADRVRLRQYMKKGMASHATFWKEHGDSFREWARNQPVMTLCRLVQLSRSAILEHVQTTYNIHSVYGVVLCAVTEQVAFFDLTKYPTDARGEIEQEFESALAFDRRGGFTLQLRQNDETLLDEVVLEMWLRQMQALGGPKLLERAARSRAADDEDEDEEEGEDADAAEPPTTRAKSSFQSDRRLVRLLIARYWADVFQKRYLADQEKVVADGEVKEGASTTTSEKANGVKEVE